MPWLIKGKEILPENLFFVHVPRCGGTSLMKCHGVPEKAMEGRSFWRKIGLLIYFHRYSAFEKANFPIFSNGNAFCVLLLAAALTLLVIDDVKYAAVASWLIAVSLAFILSTSFIFTAPVVARFTSVRRFYMVLNYHVLCRFMESIEWCTGTNNRGYMNHLTAHKLVKHKYIAPRDLFSQISTFALVRNPYSRMVSIYMYNRFGPLESFGHFIRSWHTMMSGYRENGNTEEWFVPCHAIPQYEYTHHPNSGKKMVQTIVKQEQLKLLKPKDGSKPQDAAAAATKTANGERNDVENSAPVSNVKAAKKSLEEPACITSIDELPAIVRKALLEMPHDNKRKTKKPWWSYYDQETLDLTYEMYAKDFETFGYDPSLTDKRPDLKSPEGASSPPKTSTPAGSPLKKRRSSTTSIRPSSIGSIATA